MKGSVGHPLYSETVGVADRGAPHASSANTYWLRSPYAATKPDQRPSIRTPYFVNEDQ
jgi:hypothetical protein